MPRTLALWIAFTTAGTMFALVMVFAALVLGAPGGEASQASPSASAAAPSGPIGTIEVRAFDLGFEPAMVHVDAPGTYAVTFTNDGGVLHDLTFADGTKISAEAHTVATGEVTIPAGGLTFICSVPGHADGGMRGEVMVAATGEPGASASPDASMTAQQMAAADAARTGQFPAETEGKGNQVLEPTILDNGTKRWELTASVIQWETEPGVTVEAYAYNGTVPGPQLHANVGDRIQIVLHNELPQPTTIHSHGLYVPNGDGRRAGDQPAGGHARRVIHLRVHRPQRGLAHVPQPLHGRSPGADGPAGRLHRDRSGPADEPSGRPRLHDDPQRRPARLHAERQGLPGDGAARRRSRATRPRPLHERGAADPPDAPARHAAAGDRQGRLPAARSRTWRHCWSRPASASTSLVEATEPGVWAFHCHILTHAEGPDGMFGMVTALIVEER